MLFEMTLILLGISVAGFGLAGYWDLKTTEFPDWLPYAMIVLALIVRGAFSLLTGDFSHIIYSIITGGAFLIFGLGLYWFKQWGDGDAWLLGVIGFLWPDSGSFIITATFPFPITILFNFFLIAFVYLLVYSIGLGMRSPKVSRKFFADIRNARKEITRIVGGFTIAVLAILTVAMAQLGAAAWGLIYILIFPPILLSVMVFMRYGRFVEANLFKKKIKAKDARVGDVLMEDKWRGITEEEVRKIRKAGKDVWIKEGVRFAPVFVITVIVTLLFGNLLMLFF